MENVKFFAVNMKDQKLAQALESAEQSTYEIDSELFERRTESYTRNGLASTTLIGNLATDPQPMIDPLTKHDQEKPKGNVDYINDRDYIYLASFCYETDVYWDQKTNKRHANNNYINLIFNTRGAKFAISHYYQGDGMVLKGYLRSLLQGNPTDPTRKVNVQYLVVTDFSATPGTHLRREIRSKFSQSVGAGQRKYNSIQEVLSDTSLSQEEQNKYIIELARKGNTSQNSAPAPQAKANVERYATNEVSIPSSNDVPLPKDENAPVESTNTQAFDDINDNEISNDENTFKPIDDLGNAFEEEF